ncbi:MAG: hypothetical protein WC702_04940, partial [Patescibacteria group bacterium]
MPKRVCHCEKCDQPFGQDEDACREHEEWCPADEVELREMIFRAFSRGALVFFQVGHDKTFQTDPGCGVSFSVVREELSLPSDRTDGLSLGRVEDVSSQFGDFTGKVYFTIEPIVFGDARKLTSGPKLSLEVAY